MHLKTMSVKIKTDELHRTIIELMNHLNAEMSGQSAEQPLLDKN